ncbi:alginate O-acetyltransferase complex protein AlgJ [Palleronia salina]|uniref:Alginate O-acetyltransferase complex protein AlgJ n=2 Tax=Palleronia salina TaxID=313368 RepID=A0A1M6FUR6_9RHOB|nr:alginate O-acetyltransferase complex protein AlgJ [Palleronia salina]
MMQTILKTIRYSVPILFLGYAVVVNLAIFGEGLPGEVEGDVVTGRAALSLDGLYGQAQPHRETAVGLIGAARYALIGEGRDGVTAGEDGWLFSDEEFQRATTPEIATATRIIEEVEAELDALGSELTVVPVPAKIDIYRDRGDAEAGAAMEEQYRAFRAALQEAGVESVDTRPALADVDGDPVFLTRDTHWTPAGAADVAEAVAGSEKISRGDKEFAKVPARPEEFIGDLVSFVTTDDFAPRVGLGPERVTPYVAEEADATEGGIFASDDDPIDTVLVGTSYSANEAWSFVPALKIALGRDILNLAEEGRGPIAPMRDVLSDPAFADAPPAHVIWEFPVRYLGAPKHTDTEEASNG